jgi:3',5'-cyclic AMP phosphodiesterase CpdA
MFRIAHISDLHIPPLPRIRLKDLASKRLLGLFSWHHKWKSEHKQKILDALQSHINKMNPDHICVTGDITYTTLPAEVDKAEQWMAQLAEANKISLIPGNHDAYVNGALDYAVEKWSRWMHDDDGETGFPYLHRRGPVNIVGLSSAVVTPPAISYGQIGQEQLEKTEKLLKKVQGEERPTILMLHHAPQDGAATEKRALADRKDLQAILKRTPVDLVLHGHLHYPVHALLEGPQKPIPVLGAASASAIGKRKAAAHYHILELEQSEGKLEIKVQHFNYDSDKEAFCLSKTQIL